MQNEVKTAIEYIERNLKADITSDELAAMVGYSQYHFCRVFSSITGESVSRYIVKRRLDYLLAEIYAGRKAVDVVLEYGFDTYAGFYKAFVKMYGCSPKKYISIYQTHQLKPIKLEGKNMSTHKELRDVLVNWNIDSKLKIGDFLYAGGRKIAEDKWYIGEDYILYFLGDNSDAKGLTASQKHQTVSKAISEQGLKAEIFVPTKMGENFAVIESGSGKHIFALVNRIPGNRFSKEERYNSEYLLNAKECGAGIGKLAKVLKVIENDVICDAANLFEGAVKWALPIIKRKNEQWAIGLTNEFFEDFAEKVSGLYEKLPRQLIHRNICPTSVYFKDGKVEGITEFEMCEKNVRLFDPCYAATSILSETEQDGEKYEKWLGILANILQGYDQVNPLTGGEKQAIYYVICSIVFVCLAHFGGETDRVMLQFIVTNKDKINKIF